MMLYILLKVCDFFDIYNDTVDTKKKILNGTKLIQQGSNSNVIY